MWETLVMSEPRITSNFRENLIEPSIEDYYEECVSCGEKSSGFKKDDSGDPHCNDCIKAIHEYDSFYGYPLTVFK